MACGVNGEPWQQVFRPTHVTVEWSSGVLKDVRIWGPLIRKDGSLGKRMLDHRWKRPIGVGGVTIDDLPAPVASMVRAYLAKTG